MICLGSKIEFSRGCAIAFVLVLTSAAFGQDAIPISRTNRSILQPEEGRDLAVFPLAVPSIAGPGAMMAVIVLTDNDVYTVPQRLETGVVLVVVLFITYMLLLFSDAILRVIGRQGASVLVRVMGLILCSLAVEIVLTALGVGGWTAAPH